MRLFHLGLIALLWGCGGDSTGPQTGTLAFTLDPTTCSGRAGTIELYVDSSSQGIFNFTPGASKSFTVAAGSHVAGAIERGGTQVNFGSMQVTVPANSSYTVTLTCP